MKYLVKHAEGDFRLHNSDGTETGDSWPWAKWPVTDEPTQLDRVTAVDQAAAPDDWHYRDLTIPDETVPWE